MGQHLPPSPFSHLTPARSSAQWLEAQLASGAPRSPSSPRHPHTALRSVSSSLLPTLPIHLLSMPTKSGVQGARTPLQPIQITADTEGKLLYCKSDSLQPAGSPLQLFPIVDAQRPSLAAPQPIPSPLAHTCLFYTCMQGQALLPMPSWSAEPPIHLSDPAWRVPCSVKLWNQLLLPSFPLLH